MKNFILVPNQQVSVAIDHWTTIATVHHILAFVILRLIAFKFPHDVKKFTSRHALVRKFQFRRKQIDAIIFCKITLPIDSRRRHSAPCVYYYFE